MCERAAGPAESWSWAHAQLVNDDAGRIQADLQGKPNSNVSRLVCPRRLKELTDYVACVVPAFEPGRCAVLGHVPSEDDPRMTTLAPAWNKSVGRRCGRCRLLPLGVLDQPEG
jgi:hypothetical protein